MVFLPHFFRRFVFQRNDQNRPGDSSGLRFFLIIWRVLHRHLDFLGAGGIGDFVHIPHGLAQGVKLGFLDKGHGHSVGIPGGCGGKYSQHVLPWNVVHIIVGGEFFPVMGNGALDFLQPVTVFFGEQGNRVLSRHGSLAGGLRRKENAVCGASHQGNHAHQQNHQQCNTAARRSGGNQCLEGFHRPADGRFGGGTDFLNALGSLPGHPPGACCHLDRLGCGGPVSLNGGLCGLDSPAALRYPSDGVGRGLGGFLRGTGLLLCGGGFSGGQVVPLFADFCPLRF